MINETEYNKYLKECDQIFEKYKGKYLAVDDDPVLLEGKYNYSKTVIIEFENQILFDEWYYSTDYQSILKYRLKGSCSDSVLIKGKEEKLVFYRTNIKNQEFKNIIELLNKELEEQYLELQKEYNKLNNLPETTFVLLAKYDGKVIGSGCLKNINEKTYEVKRVFIKKEMRGNGISKKIMKELEIWAKENNGKELILETGKKQLTAIKLYESIGFMKIENYGEYVGNNNSICMKKEI